MKNPLIAVSMLLCVCGLALAQPAPSDPKPAPQPATPEAKPAAPSTPAAKPAPEAGKETPKAPERPAPFGKPLDYFEATEPTVVSTGHTFTEGPVWRDGKLLFCDFLGGISELTPGGEAKNIRNDNDTPAGTAFDAEGRLLVAHFKGEKGGKVTRAKADGTAEVLLDELDGKPLGRCNDLVVRSDGSIYFTDFDGGKDGRSIIRIAPDGKAGVLPSAFKRANGLAFSPDESVLYVADYGDKLVKAFDVLADGSLSNERVFVEFKQEKGRGTPDGMKVDEAGNLYTTGPSGIWVVSPKGEKLARLDMNAPSNLAFGGQDRKTLYITEMTKVWSIKTKNAGVAPKAGKPAAPAAAPTSGAKPADAGAKK